MHPYNIAFVLSLSLFVLLSVFQLLNDCMRDRELMYGLHIHVLKHFSNDTKITVVILTLKIIMMSWP